MGTRARNRFSENYESLSNKESSDPVAPKKTLSARCATTLCRPLRIFQFLTTMLLFALIIFMTAKSAMSEPIHLSHPASILMIILTTSYLFFISIDMISQFGGHGLPDSPMLLFSFLGVLLFAVAGALLIHYRDPEDNLWALILSQVLCFIISILFLIEITLFIAYWRQKCLSWKKCYPFTPSGTCGQSEIKTIFARGNDRCIDIELGRCNLATSVSRCAIPLETTADSAVTDHGGRKISIGHRREYVDCPSSVPALAIVHTAEIQTDTGRTAITESQTARPEMTESMIQTTSRCELCNRHMEGAAPSPRISSPPPSPQSQNRYYSVIPAPVPQIQSPISQIQASVQQMPVETIPYNVPQSIPPNPQIQGGNCAICPAIYHMMGRGIPVGANPCCQSCNCGVKTPEQPRQAVPYLLEQSTQQVQSASQSDWPEQQASTSASTMTKPLIENESFAVTPSITEATTPEVAHGGSNLVVNETNSYRPSKKLPRVYETRPCPTHGAGLAARMAGLPEIVTKVTLSTICFRRNKRTQTRGKKCISPQIPGDTETEQVEEDSLSRSYVEKPEAYKSQDFRGSIGSFRDQKDNLKSRTVSDARARMISEEGARRRSRDRRKTGSSSPIKPIRDSGILLEEIVSEPEEVAANMERMQERKSESIDSTKPESSGKLLWQSTGSEPRPSVPMEKYSSWLRKDFAIREEADAEKTPERDNRESRITFREKPTTPEGSDISIREEEPSDSDSSMVIGKRNGKNRETSSRQTSKIGSSHTSRLQLEKSPEDSKSSRFRMDESSEAISRAISRSVSKIRASKADSEVSSDVASKNRLKGKIGKADSEAPSRSRISRMTIERSSKADSKTPPISKNRLNKESSRISSRSRNTFSDESSVTPLSPKIRPISDASQGSKIRPISEHSELSSRSVVRSATKERLSKEGYESPLALAKRSMSKEDPEISSGSERPSKISTDMRLSARDRLGKEDSEKSSRSITISKSREQSVAEMPSDSTTKIKESHLRLEADREDSRSSKDRLRKKDSERSLVSTIEPLSGAESDTPSESETVIDESLLSLKKSTENDSNSKQRVGTSGSLIIPTRSPSRSTSKGFADKSESDTPSVSRRRRSEVEDESFLRLESNREDSRISKDRLRKKDSENFSRSVFTSRSEEQPSKTDALTPLDSRSRVEESRLGLKYDRKDSRSSIDHLRKKDSEKSSRSVFTSRSEEQPSKTDALSPSASRSGVEESRLGLKYDRKDSGSSKDRLRKKDSEKSSRSVFTSRSEEQPSKTDALTPSASRSGVDESRLGLKYDRKDSRSSKDRLSKKDSEISSESTIELLNRAESDTPSESQTVIDESLARLEKSKEDYPISEERVRKTGSLIAPKRSSSRSASEGFPDKLESKIPSTLRTKQSEVTEKSFSRSASEGFADNSEFESPSTLRTKLSEVCKKSIGKERSEEGSVIRSADSKTNAMSHGSRIKFDDNSESHSDRSVGHTKYTIRRTPYPSKELIGREEDSDLERDIEGWRDELAEDLEGDESEIFTPSKEISRTKPRKDRSSVTSDSDKEKNIVKSSRRSTTQQSRFGSSGERSPEPKASEASRKKRSSVLSDSDEEKSIVKSLRRSSTQQNRSENSGDRSPDLKSSEISRKKRSSVLDDSDEENIVKSPKRSSTQQSRFGSSEERSPEPKPSETSRQQSKSKSGSSTRTFAYAPASWSSKGNVFQSRSRIEQSESRIEADRPKRADTDPYAGMATGLPVSDYCPPTWQCVENPQCTPSAMAMDYECVPSTCIDEHICVDPCSCRLQKCSTGPYRLPVSYSSAERSSINHYNTETSRSFRPVHELRCPRDVLRCNARKQQQQPTRVNACGSNETKKRLTLNVCYLS